jgi:precorrin-6x reductase
VASHGAAAGLAFSFGSPVLLATGSRNLTPYVLAARKAGLRVIARVLDNQESAQACRAAGLADDEVISGRGPFSVEENLKSVRAYGIGVLVTKDGGAAGGGPEKIEAARAADIPVVMIDRPAREMDGTYHDMDELITELKRLLNKHGGNPNSESGAAL